MVCTKETEGSCEHTGHVQLTSNQVRVHSKNVGMDDIELSQHALGKQIHASAVQSLVYKRTGLDLKQHQYRYINKKALKESMQISLNQNRGNGSNPDYVMTAADRLLCNIEACPHTSYSILFADYETDQLTIRKKRKNKKGVTEEVIEDMADEVDSATTFADKIQTSLSITGTGQILIAVAWTNDEAKQKFERFPEFSCSDVTEGTNTEQ